VIVLIASIPLNLKERLHMYHIQLDLLHIYTLTYTYNKLVLEGCC